MHPEIAERVERWNDNFEEATGSRFEHFFCPILHLDEDVGLCRGHIIPASTKGPGAWVPQRADVDNRLGAKLEEHLNRLDVRARPANEFLVDKELRKHFPPTVLLGGLETKYYASKGLKPQPGHTSLVVESADGTEVCNFNLKVSPEEVLARAPKHLEIRVDYDLSAQACASAIKAAHLTLFKTLGYSYVLSSGGMLLASILKELYYATNGPGLDDALTSWMENVSPIVRPMVIQGKKRNLCSLQDGAYYICQRSTAGYFAIGVTVTFGNDTFCVFVPSGEGTIDTYFSFLKSPPEAVHVRETYFRDREVDSPHWEVCGGGEPIRIPIFTNRNELSR